MKGERQDWFPTSIWHFDLIDHQLLNQKLLQSIYAEKTNDSQGVNWSNSLGWHSKPNLQQKTELQEIVRLVIENSLIVGEEIGWDLKNFTMDITSCWAVVNGKLASNFVHNHPNSVLSGVYYVKAPENCGGIFFRDARDVAHMFVPTVAELSPWTLQKVTSAATEGRMLIFPSWLNHGVEPNLSEEDRICISFNIGMSHSKY